MDQPPRARFDPEDLRIISLIALTLTLGLQMMRVVIPTITWYLRDTLGLPSVALAYYAFPIFLTAFLAAPLQRLAGPKLALWLTAGGLALLRVAEQLVFDPALDLWLSAAGTAAFLLFLPISLGRVRAERGPEAAPLWAAGLLVGLALDSAIKGLAGTLDLSWTPGAIPLLAAATLSAVTLWLTWSEAAQPGAPPLDLGGGDALPLAAFGPFLLLQTIIFQNQGWVVQVGGLSPLLGFGAVMLGNVFAGLGFTWGRSRPYKQTTLLALSGGLYVVVATATADRPGTTFVLTVLVSQFVMGWGWALLAQVASRPGRPGLGRISTALASGVLVFLILAFAYYVSLDLALPIPRTAWVPAGAVLLGIGWLLASRRAAPVREHAWRDRFPLAAAAALLVVPLAALAAREALTPPASAQPPTLKIMTYNIHSAFSRAGRQDPEAIARVIEAQGATVVGLQEVSRGWLIDGSTDLVAWFSQRLRMHVLFLGTSDPVWGNVLLSREPILEHGSGLLPKEGTLIGRGYLWARVDAGASEPLLVIVTHLHQIESEPEPRIRQVNAILDFWDGRPYTFVFGDMNARPGSDEMGLFAMAGFVDTWSEAGSGPGYTFISDDPVERIDWIWHTPDLAGASVEVLSTTASDHLPLVGTFR